MKVELLIMPLSRYWAGEYVTPGMMRAIEERRPDLYRPPARRFSKHDSRQPEALAAAREERVRLLKRRIPELIRSFPSESVGTWDEATPEEARFFELERAGFEQVLMDAQDASFDHMPHLFSASIFLPPRFLRTFQREGLSFGSIPVLHSELDKVRWSAAAEEAAESFRGAAGEAIRLNLPLFVDL